MWSFEIIWCMWFYGFPIDCGLPRNWPIGIVDLTMWSCSIDSTAKIWAHHLATNGQPKKVPICWCCGRSDGLIILLLVLHWRSWVPDLVWSGLDGPATTYHIIVSSWCSPSPMQTDRVILLSTHSQSHYQVGLGQTLSVLCCGSGLTLSSLCLNPNVLLKINKRIDFVLCEITGIGPVT